MIKESTNLKELKKVSEVIGNNLDWIQGAGGNTSLKENDNLWVKASGCWLSSSTSKEIFVSVDRSEVINSIKNNNVDNIPIKIVNSGNNFSLRPSIETALHALMPQKFVYHTHSVNLISIAVLSQGQEVLKSLLQKFNWAWVPYSMPGIQLAKSIQDVLIKKPNVIVLANHGLIVGGDTAKLAMELLINVEKKAERILRKTNISNVNQLILAISGSMYRVTKYTISNAIATDKLALKIAGKGSLYPDHVVFLGPGPMKIISIDEVEKIIKDPIFASNNSVIIVRDFGVIVHHDISENAESMLYCLANVLLRIRPDEKLCYLTKENEMELIGWDAEKYRQSIQT